MAAEHQTPQRPATDRRQALVHAAFNRIADGGFDGLRLRQVAAEAGIDHSTLHHYFPTKKDLVADVVEYTTRQFWPTVQADGSPAERLHQHLALLGRMIRERPSLFVVLRELELRAAHDAVVRSVMERHEEGWRAALTGVLRPGADAGTWAEAVDVAMGVELIMATVRGVNLTPSRAGEVLSQLERLLTRTPTSEPVNDAPHRGPPPEGPPRKGA
jgi:AcrR family transcriptional regulator